MAFSMAEHTASSAQLLAVGDDMEVSSVNDRPLDSDIELDDNDNEEFDDIMNDDANVFDNTAFDDAVMVEESDGEHEDSDMADHPEPRPSDEVQDAEQMYSQEELPEDLQQQEQENTAEPLTAKTPDDTDTSDAQRVIDNSDDQESKSKAEATAVNIAASENDAANDGSKPLPDFDHGASPDSETVAPITAEAAGILQNTQTSEAENIENETPIAHPTDPQEGLIDREKEEVAIEDDVKSINGEEVSALKETIVPPNDDAGEADTVKTAQTSNTMENSEESFQNAPRTTNDIQESGNYTNDADETHTEEEVGPPHPVVVSYENDDYALLCPRDMDDTVSYLFDDEALVFESFSEVFQASREALGISREDCYLAFDIPEMGTTIHENSPHASVQTLWSLLDLYVQLCHIDGHTTAPPLYMHLMVRQDLDQRLQALHRGLGSGFGLSSMHLSNVSHEDDDAEESAATANRPLNQNDVPAEARRSNAINNAPQDDEQDRPDKNSVAPHDNLDPAEEVATHEQPAVKPSDSNQHSPQNTDQVVESLEEHNVGLQPSGQEDEDEDWLESEEQVVTLDDKSTFDEALTANDELNNNEHQQNSAGDSIEDQQQIEDEHQNPVDMDNATAAPRTQANDTSSTVLAAEELRYDEEDDLISLPSLDGDDVTGNDSSTANLDTIKAATSTKGHKRSWSEDEEDDVKVINSADGALAPDHDAKRSRAA